MLKSLKGPNSGEIRGTAENIRDRIVTLVKSCEVELLIGDEIQHFLDRGKAHTYAAATDSLKELMDELQRPVVLMGAPRAETLFLHNGQFRSRIMASHRMRPFHLDDLGEFRGFVHALAANLPEEGRAWLSSQETSTRIFYATDGIHRTVSEFVLDVTDHASSGSPMNYATLSNVFRENVWNEPGPKLNPFQHDFAMRRLNQIGEPYQPTVLDGDNHAGSFL
ncbi:Bacterial TniB protein [compost metagenome]